MRKKIRGLIAMVILLICFSVPAAAATESFHFEQKTASVQVGKTKELSVYNNGRKVDPKKVQWKSSNPKLAAISNGKVTAKSWGNVQIYAVYGGKKISCKVYTYNQLIYTDFTGYKTTPIKTKTGKTIQLKPEKHGSVAIYKSSNTKIATVSSSGIVTPKTTGTVKITCVSLGRNRYIASAEVVVGAELKSVSTSSEIVMDKGEQKTLKVTVHPGNAYVRTITYATSNSSVVTVSRNGKNYSKGSRPCKDHSDGRWWKENKKYHTGIRSRQKDRYIQCTSEWKFWYDPAQRIKSGSTGKHTSRFQSCRTERCEVCRN